jgi:hypothetical protein
MAPSSDKLGYQLVRKPSVKAVSPGSNLNEGGEMGMTEGEVCLDETKSAPSGPPQVVKSPNPTPCIQERGS